MVNASPPLFKITNMRLYFLSVGDLGRYRMAIEDDEPKDREVWSNVARFWYNKAADKSPSIGRLYHHLAILARPYTLEQLSLYTRALTCITPFESARGSIMTLFNPILQGKDSVNRRGSSFEILLIRLHAILFTSDPLQLVNLFDSVFLELKKEGLFENYIRKFNVKFKEAGAHAAVSNLGALLEYGTSRQGLSKPLLRMAMEDAAKVKDGEQIITRNSKPRDPGISPPTIGSPQMDVDSVNDSPSESHSLYISRASQLTFWVLAVALQRPKDRNLYPLVHVHLIFIWSIREVDKALEYIEKDIPWNALCSFLNSLLVEFDTMKVKDVAKARRRLKADAFPGPDEGTARPLSEDFIVRGQLYTQNYFPPTFFSDAMIDDDERSVELPSMNEPRVERMLWLGCGIALVCLATFTSKNVLISIRVKSGYATTNKLEHSPPRLTSRLTLTLKVQWGRDLLGKTLLCLMLPHWRLRAFQHQKTQMVIPK